MKSFRNLLITLAVASWSVGTSPAKASPLDCCWDTDACFNYTQTFYDACVANCELNGGSTYYCTFDYCVDQELAYEQSCHDLYCGCCPTDYHC
jgi:hypothetical protein